MSLASRLPYAPNLDTVVKEIDTLFGYTLDSPINVKHPSYGAVGDGVADDTAAIQAAIDAAGDGTVYLPAGVYKVTGTLTLPYDTEGLVIQGAGSGQENAGTARTKINFAPATNIPAFTIGGGTASTFASWQFLRDFELVGTATAGHAVIFNSTRWCGMERVHIKGFTRAGTASVVIEGNAVTQIPNYFNRFSHCFFEDSDYGAYLRGEATAGTGANSNLFEFCNFQDHATAGVISDGGDTNKIMWCEFDGTMQYGIRFTGTNTYCIYNVAAFNQFDGTFSTIAVGVDNAQAQYNQVLYNTGLTYTFSDSGTNTRVEASMPIAAVPTVASAATIKLVAGDFINISGTTTITSVTASWPGRIVTLMFDNSLTVTDGSNLFLAGDFTATANDTITLACDGTNWREIARSAN